MWRRCLFRRLALASPLPALQKKTWTGFVAVVAVGGGGGAAAVIVAFPR